jgi:type IV pilus assembly protein PilA
LLRSARNDERRASSNGSNARERRADSEKHEALKQRGFTLVEVIVVLVILAILAAIAIPALTGYIDKAKAKTIIAGMHTQMTAIQTIINERYAEEGEFKALDSGWESNDDFFSKITIVPGWDGACAFQGFTAFGDTEYEKLTGDTESFDSTSPTMAWFQTVTDAKGSIVGYQYTRRNYFEDGNSLCVFYIANVDATNNITQKYKEDLETNNVLGVTSGFNFYSYDQAHPSANTYIRQNW